MLMNLVQNCEIKIHIRIIELSGLEYEEPQLTEQDWGNYVYPRWVSLLLRGTCSLVFEVSMQLPPVLRFDHVFRPVVVEAILIFQLAEEEWDAALPVGFIQTDTICMQCSAMN